MSFGIFFNIIGLLSKNMKKRWSNLVLHCLKSMLMKNDALLRGCQAFNPIISPKTCILGRKTLFFQKSAGPTRWVPGLQRIGVGLHMAFLARTRHFMIYGIIYSKKSYEIWERMYFLFFDNNTYFLRNLILSKAGINWSHAFRERIIT